MLLQETSQGCILMIFKQHRNTVIPKNNQHITFCACRNAPRACSGVTLSKALASTRTGSETYRSRMNG